MAGDEHEPAQKPPAPPGSVPPVPTPASAIAHEQEALVEEERRSPVRFWLKVVALLFFVGYAVAFVVGNSKSISVDFVFGTARVTLIWSVLLLLVIGFVAGVLGSHLYRQRRGQKPRKP